MLNVLVSAAPVSTAAAGYELGVGRTVPTAAAVLGLVGVVLGLLARSRARRGSTMRSWFIAAIALGVLSVGVGAVHGLNAAGGLNTGNGVAGAVIAVVLGLVGIAISGWALARRSSSTGMPVDAADARTAATGPEMRNVVARKPNER